MARVTTVPLRNHYKLFAWVCGADCVRRMEQPSARAPFHHIYQNRPKDCRYAVCGEYDMATGADRYFVWDLFNVMKDPSDGSVITPKPRLTHSDLDAIIMATVMLYNDGSDR